MIALVSGVAGTVLSTVGFFCSASCCSGSLVDRDTLQGTLLNAVALPGAYLAAAVDRSGGWTAMFAFWAGSFLAWAMLALLMYGIASALSNCRTK